MSAGQSESVIAGAGDAKFWSGLTTLGAWLLALIWTAPVLYAIWTAFHPAA